MQALATFCNNYRGMLIWMLAINRWTFDKYLRIDYYHFACVVSMKMFDTHVRNSVTKMMGILIAGFGYFCNNYPSGVLTWTLANEVGKRVENLADRG